MSAEAQLQANYHEDEFEEVDDEAEEADEIDEENKRRENKIKSTAKRRQKVLAVKSKGQLVSNRESASQRSAIFLGAQSHQLANDAETDINLATSRKAD